MYFAVQGMLCAATVPTARHVSVQRPLDQGRVDLDAAVPDHIEQRYGRQRRMPNLPVGLALPHKKKFVLDYLLDQAAAASHYIQMSAEDLPPFVWEWFAEGAAVVFVWRDTASGNEVQRVVVAVWRDLSRASATAVRPDASRAT